MINFDFSSHKLNLAKCTVAIFDSTKADKNKLFHKYLNFEPPRLYFKPMTYICSHYSFFVANGSDG